MIERTLAWMKLKDVVMRVLPTQFFLWIAVSLMFLIPIVQPVTMVLEGILFLLYLLFRFLKPNMVSNVSPRMIAGLIGVLSVLPLLFIAFLRFAVIPIHRPASLVFVEWNPRGRFELQADLNFADVDLKTESCVVRSLIGTFDGNGHAVSNLDRPFVCDIEHEGILRDVLFADAIIDGESYVGVVARENRGIISNVAVTGTLSDSSLAGGLVGVNRGTIEHAVFDGSISGTISLGGIAGRNSGTIRTSRTVGAILGEGMIGGIVGNHDNGLIEDCLTDMDLSGSVWVGGIAGMTGGEIVRVVVFGDLAGPDVGVVRPNTLMVEAVALFGGFIDSSEAVWEENVYYLQNQSFDIPEGYRLNLSELDDSFYLLVLGFDPEIWDWNTENGIPELR